MIDKKIYLHNISTTVPEGFYTQEFALDFLLKLQGDTLKKRNFLKRVYQKTGIYKRHTVINDYGKDPSEYTFFSKNQTLEPEPSTSKRNDLYIEESKRLSIKAVENLLEKLPSLDKNSITHIITVSCTGFSAPGVDFFIAKELELNPAVNRFHIGFMGCYGAFPALKLARNICLSEPDARVLVVNVEFCTLHFQKQFEPDFVVASALFSDGVSAALISAHPEDSEGNKIILHNFASQYISNSQDDMAWKIGDTGFTMKLSVYVPELIQKNIKQIMSTLFSRTGVNQDDINIWAIHPGGMPILKKVEKELKLPPDALDIPKEILKNFGNMSSATIMFVLQAILENDQAGKIFSVAFGPGLTIESGLLEKITL